MSAKVNQIIEIMKTLTLMEASELIDQIEFNFGVDAGAMPVKWFQGMDNGAIALETCDVVLDAVPSNRRVVIAKAVWMVTGVDLKQAKALVKRPPAILKTAVDGREAAKIRAYLESYGASVSFR
jgi:large subunit ribosomal protein L7/L12